MAKEKSTLAQVRNLNVEYKIRTGWVKAITNVSLDLYRGEILGLVGESGCGKSTLGKALMRLLPRSARISGSILFDDQDILKFNDHQIRDFRGRRASMIFQDPMTSLNPIQRINEHLLETIWVHEHRTKKTEAMQRIERLVERLGVQRQRLPDYPHQLSGGMRQRVMISLGLLLNADLIVADEATTSLDVIVEAGLLDLLREIRTEFNLSMLVITHNIALVAELADRIAVMYAGQMMEVGSIYDVFDKPQHPYTQGLLHSVPNISLKDRTELYRMTGEPPDLSAPPPGCRFAPRCPKAMPVCTQQEPALQPVKDDHLVHCWLYQEHPEKAPRTAR